MELRHLRYFVAAVEEGSMQGAARRMNVAQPALSRQIRDLEASLACELFVRGARGVTPTRAGQAFYREVLTLLGGLDEAGRRARRMGLDQAGAVRLGLVRTSSKYAFARKAVAAFKTERPDAEIAFTRGASPDLAAALQEGRLDLALVYERRLGSRGFGERLAHKERYVLAAHPSHRLAAPGPVSLAELSGEPLVWLSRRNNADNHDALLQQFRLHGAEPVIAHVADSHEAQIELVLVSGGACLTPASSLLSVPSGALVFRPLPDFEIELHLRLTWRLDLGESPAAALLQRFEAAIRRHQDDIAAGRAAWTRLHGHSVASAPDDPDETSA
jgi:DNA-binding transcriptional LysR family regulator